MPPLAKALMTAIYPVPDIAAAKSWYAGVFGDRKSTRLNSSHV